jgi:hypothetical protein
MYLVAIEKITNPTCTVETKQYEVHKQAASSAEVIKVFN